MIFKARPGFMCQGKNTIITFNKKGIFETDDKDLIDVLKGDKEVSYKEEKVDPQLLELRKEADRLEIKYQSNTKAETLLNKITKAMQGGE